MKFKRSIWIENLGLSLLGGFFLWFALRHYLFLPYTDNEGAFVLLGREMLHGAKLYADIWDHKPPLLFDQSWGLQSLFSLSEIHLHLYVLFIHALNAFLIFYLARRLGFSRSGTWVSALSYLLLLFPPLFQPWAAEADLLMQPFLLFSFWAAFSPKKWILFLSGFFWTAAFMTKQSALFFLPVYLMAGAFSSISKIARWVSGALGLGAILILPFVWDGRWMDFNEALIGFNQYYIEKGWLFFFATAGFRDFLVHWTQMVGWSYGLAFLGLVLAGVRQGFRGIHPRMGYVLGAWFLGALISGGISGYFFTYYFIVFLPPLALGCGWAFMKGRETGRWDLKVLFFLMAIEVLAVGVNFKGCRDKIFSYGQYPAPRYFTDKIMGWEIAREARPGDELLSWSDDPQIYLYAGLKPFLKTPFINHLTGMPYEAWRVYKDFSTQPPRFCVVSRMAQVLLPPEWFEKELAQRYIRVKSMGSLDLYLLR